MYPHSYQPTLSPLNLLDHRYVIAECDSSLLTTTVTMSERSSDFCNDQETYDTNG